MNLRAFLAFVLVTVGTMLSTQGPESVVRLAGFVWANIETILMATGVVIALGSLVRRGPVLVAFVLIGTGAAIHAARHRLWTADWIWTGAGLTMTLLGGVMIFGLVSKLRDWDDPVQRVVAILRPQKFVVPEGSPAPQYLAVRTFGQHVTVDFTQCRHSSNHLTEVAITSFGGVVEIRAPNGWGLVAGRLRASVRQGLSGDLDDVKAHPFPRESTELQKIAKRRGGAAWSVLVIHAAGVGGSIHVAPRHMQNTTRAGSVERDRAPTKRASRRSGDSSEQSTAIPPRP